jgi:hypothetical protein
MPWRTFQTQMMGVSKFGLIYTYKAQGFFIISEILEVVELGRVKMCNWLGVSWQTHPHMNKIKIINKSISLFHWYLWSTDQIGYSTKYAFIF